MIFQKDHMVFPAVSFRNFFSLACALLCFLFFPSQQASATSTFPHYSIISKNVHFWEKIYSTYSVNTGVLHDRDDLSLIYATINLKDKNLSSGKRYNRRIIKNTKKQYKAILLQLASGKKPITRVERRIYNMFPGSHKLRRFKRAANNLRVQVGLKEQFQEGVVRSGAYISKMKQIFRSYGLPEDLAYLPHVESSFNVNAYSKYGAAGAWQFTRSTGKNFMTVNYVIDERRDPIKSTHAAAKYLRQNYQRLGSWPLAITAYNYGHAGMERAVTQEGNYINIFKNYNKGRFKFASRNFYSEFLAAMRVAKRYEALPHLTLDKPSNSLLFLLPGYASVFDVQRHFRIKIKTLKKLNPALQKAIWSGEKYIPRGYQLRLPRSQTIHHLAKVFPATLIKKSQKRSKFYLVKRGDTASGIAKKHGVTLAALAAANNLNRSKFIYTGQTLRIPYRSSSTYIASKTSTTRPKFKSVIPILKGGKKKKPLRQYVFSSGKKNFKSGYNSPSITN